MPRLGYRLEVCVASGMSADECTADGNAIQSGTKFIATPFMQ
jgi:hypothetical protein